MDATPQVWLGILSLSPLPVTSLGFLPVWQFSGESDFSPAGFPQRDYCVTENGNMHIAISSLFHWSKQSYASSDLRGGDKYPTSQWEEWQRICASVAIFNLLHCFMDYGEG